MIKFTYETKTLPFLSSECEKKKTTKKPHIGTIIYVLREHPKSHTHSPILIDQVQSWISNNLMYEI